MTGPMVRELLRCLAPDARQTLLGAAHGDNAPAWEALVEDDGLGGPIREPRVSAVVLVVASTDCNSLVA